LYIQKTAAWEALPIFGSCRLGKPKKSFSEHVMRLRRYQSHSQETDHRLSVPESSDPANDKMLFSPTRDHTMRSLAGSYALFIMTEKKHLAARITAAGKLHYVNILCRPDTPGLKDPLILYASKGFSDHTRLL
jgi:hypothetical protein